MTETTTWMPARATLRLERIEHTEHIALIRGGGQLDAAFVEQLADACAAVPDDVRAVLLRPDPAVWLGFAGATAAGDLFAAVAELPQPTLAVLEGPLRGGGLELALTADLRIAHAACEISFSALTQEFPRAGGLQRLTRAVGRSRATQLLFLESAIDARAALDWGLVNALADDPFAAAREAAQTIASRGPIAARYAKDAVRHGLEMPLAQALHYETELTILLQDTADRAEGVDAFVHKRTATFSGR